MTLLIFTFVNRIIHWLITYFKPFFKTKATYRIQANSIVPDPELAKVQITNNRFRPKPPWVLREVIKLCALMRKQGSRKIADSFNSKYHTKTGESVTHQYVVNKRSDHQYAIVQKTREIKHNIPKAVVNNLTWGIDLVTITDDAQNQRKVLGIIDYGSRANLLLTETVNK